MANNNSMSFNIDIDGPPSKKQRNMEGSDDDSSLPTLVSIDYVRVNEVVLSNDGNEGKKIQQIYHTDDDTSETDGEDRKIIDDERDDEESDDEDKILVVYGDVIVTDCWGDEVVYHQYPNILYQYPPPLPLTLPLPQPLHLRGPRRAISGDGKFIINVSISGLVCTERTIKEIAEGEIVWDPYKQDNKLSYNEPLQQHVSGTHGSVSVGYSVIQRALSATIDVVWTNENKSKGELYGTIKAVRLLQGSPTERILFHMPEDKCYAKYVVSGRSLFFSPLLGLETSPPYFCRDAYGFPFPVQMRSTLTIEVDLRDHLSPDGQSVQGVVQFTAGFGVETRFINGECGAVKVSMTCE